MDQKLAQEFQATFSGKTYDEKEIERELYKIAFKCNRPACIVIYNFYIWAGVIEDPNGAD